MKTGSKPEGNPNLGVRSNTPYLVFLRQDQKQHSFMIFGTTAMVVTCIAGMQAMASGWIPASAAADLCEGENSPCYVEDEIDETDEFVEGTGRNFSIAQSDPARLALSVHELGHSSYIAPLQEGWEDPQTGWREMLIRWFAADRERGKSFIDDCWFCYRDYDNETCSFLTVLQKAYESAPAVIEQGKLAASLPASLRRNTSRPNAL